MIVSILFRFIMLLMAFFAAFVLPYGLPVDDSVPPPRLMDPTGGFVHLANETLYYTHTPGSGETVILLHGFGGSTVTWWDTTPALSAAGYDVYALDLLGFGLSQKGWRHDYSRTAQAARVIHFMDAIGINRAHVVGHSMGGGVAAVAAINYPDRVDRLALVAPAILAHQGGGMFDVPKVVFGVLDLPAARRWGQILMRRFVVPQFETLLYDAAYADDQITPELEDGYRRALFTPEWELGLMGIMRDADSSPLPVGDIRAPTLLLWGSEDSWVPPEDGLQLEKLIPGAQRITLAGVGHLLMHENPNAFNAALLAFLSGEP